jgi:hypothetical protein
VLADVGEGFLDRAVDGALRAGELMSKGSSPVSSVSIPLVVTSLCRSERVGWGGGSVMLPPEARNRLTVRADGEPPAVSGAFGQREQGR